jgi:hypothetical protein
MITKELEMSGTQYTVEVYVRDGRVRGKMVRGRVNWGSKNFSGFRFIEALDFHAESGKAAEELAKQVHKHRGLDKLHFKVHQTYVTCKNLMSGEEYQERYDTPSFCSPSSESYWSM